MSEPQLSVVVVAGSQRRQAAQAVASVLAQQMDASLEVIVVDACSDQPLPGIEPNTIRIVPARNSQTIAELRAEGVRQARAPIVAFLEEHAAADPGWAAALLEAFDGPWAAVGPAVVTANSNQGLSRAAGVTYFARWMPPAESGEDWLLPGHNTAYRREALLAFDDLEERLLCEMRLHRALIADGEHLYFEPAAVIVHANETTTGGFLALHFAFHRLYGALELAKQPLVSRVFHAAFTLPRLLIQFARLAAGRRLMLWELGICLLGYGADAAGDMVGMFCGLGSAPTRFTDLEINLERPGAVPRTGSHHEIEIAS